MVYMKLWGGLWGRALTLSGALPGMVHFLVEPSMGGSKTRSGCAGGIRCRRRTRADGGGEGRGVEGGRVMVMMEGNGREGGGLRSGVDCGGCSIGRRK